MAASSSRRTVVSALLALGGAAAFAGWRFGEAGGAPPPEQLAGPWLLLRTGQQPPRSGPTPAAALLALSSLPPELRARWLDGLAELLDSVEARAHPFGIDLLEVDVDAAVTSARALLLPVLTAANALSMGRWHTVDGSLHVEAATFTHADGARKLAAWPSDSEPRDEQADNARFLAWPVAAAALLRCLDPAEAARAAAALRERAIAPGSPVALVVDARALREGPGQPDADRFRDIARRARRLRGARATDRIASLLDLFAQGATEAPRLPWLELGASDVLVVPRMGALARRRAFVDEVRSVAQTERLDVTAWGNA